MTTTLNIPKRRDGRNTRKLRALFGYEKQEEFAKKCGWSQQKMSKLERQEIIEPGDLDVISGVLGIPAEKIIEYDEDMTINNIQSNFTTQDTGTTATYIENFNQDVSEKILDALTTLTKTVADLATQVAALKKGTNG